MAQDTTGTPNIAQHTGRFARDVWDEMLKVNWTSRAQLWQTTKVVIVSTLVMAAYLYIADYLFAAVLTRFLD